MKTPNRKERVALTRAEIIGTAETNRWHMWEVVSLVDRQRVMGLAGFPKERASAPIASFNDADRERVRAALAAHIGRMEFVIQCMAASNTTPQGYLH